MPGLVALGDSITVGDDGITSWASLVASARDLALTSHAVDGADASAVLAEQVPRLVPGFALGTLYVGVNDARAPWWDPAVFAPAYDAILARLTECAAVVLVCTVPADLGTPTAAPKPLAANELIRAAADRHGALVCELEAFGGPLHVQADLVHPTARGQRWIADRALAVLRS